MPRSRGMAWVLAGRCSYFSCVLRCCYHRFWQSSDLARHACVSHSRTRARPTWQKWKSPLQCFFLLIRFRFWLFQTVYIFVGKLPIDVGSQNGATHRSLFKQISTEPKNEFAKLQHSEHGKTALDCTGAVQTQFVIFQHLSHMF